MTIKNTVFYKFYRYWNQQAQVSFLACVIAGLLVHLYAFTNIIPNADGLSRIYDPQQMTVSGRFFLHYASMLNRYLQAPMLIGILSVLFIALSAMFVTDLLEIRGNYTAAAVGIFMIVFPAMTYTYMFMFTAAAYAVGIFLAVVSVWVYRKFRYGFVIGIVFFACAAGIYQTYFAVAIALAMLYVLKITLDEQVSDAAVFRQGLMLVVFLLCGMALYYGILQIFLKVKGVTLLSYRGMDTFMSDMSISSLLHSAILTYKDFIRYLIKPGAVSYNTPLIIVCNLLLFLLAAAAFFSAFRRYKKFFTVKRILILLLIICLVPLGFNFTRMLAPNTPIMRYSLVFVYIALFAVIDWTWEKEKVSVKKISLITEYGTVIISSLMILLFAQIANTAYTASETAHRATEAFASNLVSRVESLEGYNKNMKVIVIGGFPSDVYYSTVQGFDMTSHTSCLPDTVLLSTKHVYQYVNDWLNVPWQSPDEAELIQVSDSGYFQEMPLYPSDGSVQIVDGAVIVKLAEAYTPMQEYEIAYENRK